MPKTATMERAVGRECESVAQVGRGPEPGTRAKARALGEGQPPLALERPTGQAVKGMAEAN